MTVKMTRQPNCLGLFTFGREAFMKFLLLLSFFAVTHGQSSSGAGGGGVPLLLKMNHLPYNKTLSTAEAAAPSFQTKNQNCPMLFPPARRRLEPKKSNPSILPA